MKRAVEGPWGDAPGSRATAVLPSARTSAFLCLFVLVVSACGDDAGAGTDGGVDATLGLDAGSDASMLDSGPIDDAGVSGFPAFDRSCTTVADCTNVVISNSMSVGL